MPHQKKSRLAHKEPSSPTKLFVREERKLAILLQHQLEHENVTENSYGFLKDMADKFKKDAQVENLPISRLQFAVGYILRDCTSSDRTAKLHCVKEFCSMRGYQQLDKIPDSQAIVTSLGRKNDQTTNNSDFSTTHSSQAKLVSQTDSSEDEKLEGVFVVAPSFCQPYARKFLFINYSINDCTKVLKRATQDLVLANGGVIVKAGDIDKADNRDVFVINFGPQNERINKFLDTHQHDIYCPSLIFAAVENNLFEADSCQMFIDHLRFHLEKTANHGMNIRRCLDLLPESKHVPTVHRLVDARNDDPQLVHISIKKATYGDTSDVKNNRRGADTIPVNLAEPIASTSSSVGQMEIEGPLPEKEQFVQQAGDSRQIIPIPVGENLGLCPPVFEAVEQNYWGNSFKLFYEGPDFIFYQCLKADKYQFTPQTRVVYIILQMQKLFTSNGNNWEKMKESIETSVFNNLEEQVRLHFRTPSGLKTELKKYLSKLKPLLQEMKLPEEFITFLASKFTSS